MDSILDWEIRWVESRRVGVGQTETHFCERESGMRWWWGWEAEMMRRREFSMFFPSVCLFLFPSPSLLQRMHVVLSKLSLLQHRKHSEWGRRRRLDCSLLLRKGCADERDAMMGMSMRMRMERKLRGWREGFERDNPRLWVISSF